MALPDRASNTPRSGPAFWVSLVVAVAGASMTLMAAYIIEKKKPRGDQLLYTLTVLPAAIPGVVLGLGYILAFNKPYFLIYGTIWIIIINIVICQFHPGGSLRNGQSQADR